MGKTGSTHWVQIKGVKGQIRLVPRSEGDVKRPGPNQRFKAGARPAAPEQDGMGYRGGKRRGGGGRRRPAPGGRGHGEVSPTANPLIRRPMRRAKSMVLGAKQKSR